MADDGAVLGFETSANVAGVSIREAQGDRFSARGADIGWRAGERRQDERRYLRRR